MTDRTSLLAALDNEDAPAAAAATAVLDWGENHPTLSVRWTRAGDIGFGVQRTLLRVWSEGTLELKVNTLRKLEPRWNDERIEQLLQRLEQVDGVTFKGNRPTVAANSAGSSRGTGEAAGPPSHPPQRPTSNDTV